MTVYPAWTAPASEADTLDWLRLARSQNIGPATFWELLSRYHSAAAALEALPAIAQRAGRTASLRVASQADADREIEKIHAFGAKLVPFGTADYPPLLRQIDAPPPLLTVLGTGATAGPRTVAIVGARNASAAGRKMASLLAADLGRFAVTVASGLARGVDTAAHAASLTSGAVAVTAGGIDIIYPRENAALHAQIAAAGAIITEMPFGAEPIARSFPRRNRLISGISAGVIVIEAAKRSGSLITARFALEQGREVFAVPGSPLDPRAQGTNSLIRNGATLVQSAEDVLETLDSQFCETLSTAPFTPAPQPGSADRTAPRAAGDPSPKTARIIRELLSPSPVGLDDLARLSQLPISAVSAIVLELEIAGHAVRHPGGRVSAA